MRRRTSDWAFRGLALVVGIFISPLGIQYGGVPLSDTSALENLDNAPEEMATAAAAATTTTTTYPLSATETAPLTGTDTVRRSKHPKWKLWEEMNEQQQDQAIKEVSAYLDKYGRLIRPPTAKFQPKLKHGSCTVVPFGVNGGHALCGPQPLNGCVVVSFGINDDPSFDIEIANKWNCRGFAADPTVTMQSKLHENVTFHNFAATMVETNKERKQNKGGAAEWWYITFPEVIQLLKVDKIDILKIDCEGCEIALSRDIILQDPDFFKKVDQVSIETHMTRAWINTRETFYYFALQFPLLEEAGHFMEFSHVFGCGRPELLGCIDEIKQTAWPCKYQLAKTRGGPFPFGESCQDFLWRKIK